MTEWETLQKRAKDLEDNFDEEVMNELYNDIRVFHKELKRLNESARCNIEGNEVLILGMRVAAGDLKQAFDNFNKDTAKMIIDNQKKN